MTTTSCCCGRGTASGRICRSTAFAELVELTSGEEFDIAIVPWRIMGTRQRRHRVEDDMRLSRNIEAGARTDEDFPRGNTGVRRRLRPSI